MRAGDSLPVTLIVERDPRTGRYTAAFSSDRLRVSGIPFSEARVEGCCDVTLVLRGDRTTTDFVGRVQGQSFSGVFREGTSDRWFAYSRVPAAPAAFEERAITFPSGAATLAGSLLLPLTGDSLQAVVFLQGSGAEGRWASRYLAAQLANHGIAALIFDKRGVGGSSGDWRHATPDDLAGDGAAAVSSLLQEPHIDPRRIGLHRHSQGGTLAPLVAARSPGVAFVIGSAAAGLPTDSTELFAPPPASDPYWSFSTVFAQYQALYWWAQVRVRVLLIYGAADQRVQAEESAARIAAVLRNVGNADVTVRIFPGADHTFRLPPGPGGWPVTAPDYIGDLLDWLARR